MKDNTTQASSTTTSQAGDEASQTNQIRNPNLSAQLAQSNAFLFWLTLTLIATTIGVIIARMNITGDTIPLQWIMLYVFTTAFLISISLTIFRFGLIAHSENMSLLVNFHEILLGVLIFRAILDYIIGRRIYFPESYLDKKPSQS